MFEVQIDGRFRAAHQLRLADGGVEPLHEHDWPVTVVVSGPRTGAAGCLVDFHRLADDLAAVLAPLDGGDLNEHAELGPANPSAEHVARYVAEQLARRLGDADGVRVARVTVGEAPGCRASYVPDGPGGGAC